MIAMYMWLRLTLSSDSCTNTKISKCLGKKTKCSKERKFEHGKGKIICNLKNFNDTLKRLIINRSKFLESDRYD